MTTDMNGELGLFVAQNDHFMLATVIKILQGARMSHSHFNVDNLFKSLAKRKCFSENFELFLCFPVSISASETLLLPLPTREKVLPSAQGLVVYTPCANAYESTYT